MFVDHVRLRASSGSGGNGSASFRREKFVPFGGPDGGDGGNGGNVIARVDPHLGTLLDLRLLPQVSAGRGENGKGKRRTGGRGADCILRVPPGTLIRNAATGEVLADLTTPGQEVVLLTGGRGGRGNVHFATPTHRAPDRADPGGEAAEAELDLELKLMADVGLVGQPNAGKSTLLSRISAARPKIADYPFTTLTPNLGIVRVGDYGSFVAADIPGLIEGAHAGKGLGFQFLRHIERTRVLLFMVDASASDAGADLRVLRQELERFSPGLLRKPCLLAATKIDLLPPSRRGLSDIAGHPCLPISAVTGHGLEALLRHLDDLVRKSRSADMTTA